MNRGVFVLINKNDPAIKGKRIFKSRIVDEIKGKETDHLFEKSRLVVQAWNDTGKKEEVCLSASIREHFNSEAKRGNRPTYKK
ncbi:hypothetical protein PZA11_001335 [Diplocarpon coronariae]